MATQYDNSIIQKLVDELYRRANLTIALWTIIGLLVSFVITYFLFYEKFSITRNQGNSQSGIYLIFIFKLFLCMGICGGIGYLIGQRKAFMGKFFAQSILCLVTMERNTAAIATNTIHQLQLTRHLLSIVAPESQSASKKQLNVPNQPIQQHTQIQQPLTPDDPEYYRPQNH